MKTLTFCLLAAVLLPMAASAQTFPIDRGSILLDGSASLTSIKLGDNRGTIATLRPSAQLFVTPGLAVGGTVGLFYRHFDGNDGQSSFSNFDVLLGPAVHYYFGGPDARLFPFVGGDVSFDVDDINSSLGFTVEGGGAYMVARNVAITGAAFFSARTEVIDDSNTIGLRFGVSAFVY